MTGLGQLTEEVRELRADMNDWQSSLEVNLNPRKDNKVLDKMAKVESGGGIR